MSLGLSGGAVASLAGGALGLLGGGSSSGGQQTQTATKEPWSVAAPWLTSNVTDGQNLQQYYQQNPFNAQQQQAYMNQAGNSDYARQLVSSVFGQGAAPAFDRNNPSARPQNYQLPAFTGGFGGSGSAGAQGSSTAATASLFGQAANPYTNGTIQQPAPAQAAAPAGAYDDYAEFRKAGGVATRDSFNAMYGGVNPYKTLPGFGSDPVGR